MELDDINAGLASQGATEKKTMEDANDMTKQTEEVIDHVAEKRLVRKLDFW